MSGCRRTGERGPVRAATDEKREGGDPEYGDRLQGRPVGVDVTPMKRIASARSSGVILSTDQLNGIGRRNRSDGC